MPVQRKIFISYRQKDNPDFVDRIRDWFIIRYGRDNVFMDFDSIPTGVKFADHIRSAVQQSNAVIVVIGPRWLKLMREKAANFEEDYVRVELGLALQLGKPVIPICIVGATVPRKAKLPPELHPLLEYNAAFLERSNFLDKIHPIIDSVEKSLNESDLLVIHDTLQSRIGKSSSATYNEAMRRVNTQYAEAYNDQGLERKRKDDLDGAIANYNEAIRLHENYIDAYFNRGIAYYAKGDLKDALYNFDETIILDPNHVMAYLNRAIVRKALNDIEGAIADYQQYLDLGGGTQNSNQVKIEQLIRDLQKKLQP